MIRKITIALFISFALVSCNNDKKDETALLNAVIKTHDKLMADDGRIMKNKMLLDSNTTKSTKDSVAIYKKLLDSADNSMMDWMHKFNPDFTGKSHTHIMTYLKVQQAQILKLDSQINNAVSASADYITREKAAAASAAAAQAAAPKSTTVKSKRSKRHKR